MLVAPRRRFAAALHLLGAAGLFGCSVYDPSLLEAVLTGAPRDAGGGSKPAPMDAAASDAAPEPDAGKDSGPPPAGTGAGTGGSGECLAGSGGSACSDGCPLDPDKSAPGVCGCGVSDTDTDGDGTPDCRDGCVDNADKQQPGTCGCALSEADEDDDGTPDCVDGCPADETKTSPGECGCGARESDINTDGDSALDCVDGCFDDPDKTAPGVCGCGVAETDTDLDETPNCKDQCPSDPNKLAPGVCGCGIADDDSGTVVGCVALKNALVRRYRFDGSGTSVTDAKGGAAGMVVGGASLTGSGALALSGTNQYVDLPNGVLSGLTDATVEVWINWNGGAQWQRVFDFGTSGTEGSQNVGQSYLFLTPSVAGTGFMRLAFSANGSTNETQVNSLTRALPSGVMCHLAAVVDDTNNKLALYLNTTLEGSVTFNGHLSSISDVNDWIGRSQYNTDPELAGTISELRIYNIALSAAQLNFSLTQGPDPAYLQ